MSPKVTQKEVKDFLDQHPNLKKRSMKYVTISQMVPGVTPEQAQRIVNINRRIQDVLPNDPKGEALAEEYRYEEGYMSQETSRQYVLINGQKFAVK